ncbi:MAG: peptide deformylase [Bacteroidetes bacterium]|nr:peptide deformylase [Bacteroidota bacterium]
MILPIVANGHPALKKVAKPIEKDHPGLPQLISDMFETMYSSDGVGLAASQINHSIRLFIIDAEPYAEKYPETKGFKKVFINAEIYLEEGEPWIFNEGCLSFPGLREDILRKQVIHIRYVDEHFQPVDETYDGVLSRIIQHEYDHIQGVVMTDRISPLKKMLLKRKLTDISAGNVDVSYRMVFPLQKKR